MTTYLCKNVASACSDRLLKNLPAYPENHRAFRFPSLLTTFFKCCLQEYSPFLKPTLSHCCLITLSSSDSLLVFHRYFRVKFPQYPSQCIIWSQQGAISNKSCPQIDPNSNFWVSESMRVNNLLSLWTVSYLFLSLFAIFIKKRHATHHKQTLKCSFYIILDGPTGKTPWSPKLAAENFTLQWQDIVLCPHSTLQLWNTVKCTNFTLKL